MPFKNILLEKHSPGIVVIKIDRAEVLNALNTETLRELRECLKIIEKDAEVRVIILTGSGDKSFIAGADISEMAGMNTSDAVVFARLGHEVTKLLELMDVPTIAAVNGFALGGGTEIAISCDFILASENAVFGQPEVGLGVIPGFGATIRLSRFVGLPRAKELIFSGRKIKADEALRMGLVNRVYPKESFMEEVLGIAKIMSLNSKGAVSLSKKLLNEFAESVGRDYKVDSEIQDFGSLFGKLDQVEGMKAFLEKRKPKFKGLI